MGLASYDYASCIWCEQALDHEEYIICEDCQSRAKGRTYRASPVVRHPKLEDFQPVQEVID